MRIAILCGVLILVLGAMATSFPTIMEAQNSTDVRSTNMEDHMAFTRELAQQGSQLNTLSDQHKTLAVLPERLARLEERLNILVQMVYALLAGVCGLLFKDLWGILVAIRVRQKSSVTID